GLHAFEPEVEPAQRLVLILINRAVEINPGTDHHLFGTAPVFPGGKRTGKVQTVVAPACAEIRGNRRFFILRAVLAPERPVERVQHEIDDQRVGSDIGILQGFTSYRLRDNFLIAQRKRDSFLIRGFTMLLFVETAILWTMKTIAPVTDKAVR